MATTPQSQPQSSNLTPFQQHLSFFDLSRTGTITFPSTLRAHLLLGLNFPVSFVSALGLHALYSTSTTFPYIPLLCSQICIRHVPLASQRTMLEGFAVCKDDEALGYSLSDFRKVAKTMGWIDWVHVMSLWALAADGRGLVAERDVRLFQEGLLLPVLQRRRTDRSDVLPFLRGGPLLVGPHSWAVDKLLDVKVYRDMKRAE